MTLIKSISGIRGTIGGQVGENLTPIDAVKFASAYGIWLKQQRNKENFRVVVGRDARISGEMIQNLVMNTLVGLGIHVIDLGLSTTPTVEVAVPMEHADGGIILTASHNPKQWNALKLLNAKGEFLNGEEGAKILAIAETDTMQFADVDNLGKITKNQAYIDLHIDEVLKMPLVNKKAIKDANFKFYKSDNGKRYVADQAKFLNENTEPVEGWQDIRDSIQKQIKTAQSIIDSSNSTDVAANQDLKIKKLRRTLSNNMLNNLPRGEWVKPKASKYANPKYTAIQNDPKKKKYYDFVLEELQKGYKMVGTKRKEKNSWDNMSYLMPSIRKEGLDRAKEQGAVTAARDLLRDGFSITETADDMAIYDNATGELQRNIPVRYTNLVASKDISKDIASSLYRFRHMAHNFKT